MKSSILILVCGLTLNSAEAATPATPAPAPTVLVKKGDRLGHAQWGDAHHTAASELSVTLIGEKIPVVEESIVVRPTTLIPLPVEPTTTTPPPAKPTTTARRQDPPIPDGTLRPDANGQILLTKRHAVELTSASDGLRNPWGIRIAPASSITDYQMQLQGAVAGPKPVVIINGQNLTRGERIGIFTLAEIRRDSVLLEYDGSFFLISEGRKVTVRIPKE